MEMLINHQTSPVLKRKPHTQFQSLSHKTQGRPAQSGRRTWQRFEGLQVDGLFPEHLLPLSRLPRIALRTDKSGPATNCAS